MKLDSLLSILSFESLRDWANSKLPDKIVGYTGQAEECPLAYWYRDHGAISSSVGLQSLCFSLSQDHIKGKIIRYPFWVRPGEEDTLSIGRNTSLFEQDIIRMVDDVPLEVLPRPVTAKRFIDIVTRAKKMQEDRNKNASRQGVSIRSPHFSYVGEEASKAGASS